MNNLKIGRLGALERRLVVLCLVLFTAAIFLFSKLPERIAAMEEKRKWEGEVYAFANLVSEIHSEIKRNYVEEIDSKALFQGAIRGMFDVLDPHSSWLQPSSLDQLERDTEGEFAGVGLHITLDRRGALTVIAPIPGSPAARVGMQSLDRIVKIDDESTEGIRILEAVKRLTGPVGSKVDVKVARAGEDELLEFTIIRDTIKVDSVYYWPQEDHEPPVEGMDGEIGYLRIRTFSEGTPADVKKALKEFNKRDVKGVIVDLRNNTGGLLDAVIRICNDFMPKGEVIVSIKGRREENNRVYKSENDPISNQPLIVLVNIGSASASEIFAGAVQDTDRGFIVGPGSSVLYPDGEPTFGKGTVQTIMALRNSLDRSDSGEPYTSGMRLTTAKYYTPSGRSIHEIGITPDFQVEMTTEQRIAASRLLYGDPDVLAILESGEEEDENQNGTSAEEEEVPERDVQLEEGLKSLRMMMMFEKRLAKS